MASQAVPKPELRLPCVCPCLGVSQLSGACGPASPAQGAQARAAAGQPRAPGPRPTVRRGEGKGSCFLPPANPLLDILPPAETCTAARFLCVFGLYKIKGQIKSF